MKELMCNNTLATRLGRLEKGVTTIVRNIECNNLGKASLRHHIPTMLSIRSSIMHGY